MKIEHIRQICTWLAATDITEFELQGPGVRRRHCGRASST